MWILKRYDASEQTEWNDFVRNSRNSTFLFDRNFMDYHSHRFTDFSLMAYRKGKLVGILPANIEGETLYSHQGLTYGGWLWEPKGPDVNDIYSLWIQWLHYCNQEGIKTIIYKTVPYIYCRRPSEEDIYCLFLSRAVSKTVNISTSIDLSSNPGFNKLQRRHLNHSSDSVEITLYDSPDRDTTDEFYRLLKNCLRERHGIDPVHTEDEIQLLIERFPNNIEIWSARSNQTSALIAAVCVFKTVTCAHCQYIATSLEGREKNALSVLFYEMIDHYQTANFKYFDFGISNEDGGRLLNAGLNRQKTSYGGTGVAYQTFEINVAYALESLPNVLWPKHR